MEKINITGMTIEELEAFVEDIGEKSFRGRQLFNWIYVKKAAQFSEMTNLSKTLREKLQSRADIGCLQLLKKKTSDGSSSAKYIFRLHDGHVIESVYIAESGRRTLCLSCQVGCALKCAFCATGRLGLKRNLSAGEIIDQVLYIERDIGHEMTNIVFMGMGEPFKNYDHVIKAANLIKHPDGIGIGYSRIVISTAGIVPAIFRFADEGHRFKLAVSLHSAVNEDREKIMPISRKYSVEKLVEAVKYYIQKSGCRPTFEYVIMAGVNDRKQDADALRKLIRGLECKVNLIPYNPTVSEFERPRAESVDQFARWLFPIQTPVSVRWSKGVDIDAACGQLAGEYMDSKTIS